MNMTLTDFENSVIQEIQTIMSPQFTFDITDVSIVPSTEDPAITHASSSTSVQRCKRMETCVLFVDIRESTRLGFAHRKSTMAQLYSAFVRAMILCADYAGGKVRDIVGDRVMVVFDRDDCHETAVLTALLMHRVIERLLNPYFTQDEVRCGIGIDYGQMLIAKAGMIKKGDENPEYKSLVWLGRPANVASKLTDEANKRISTLIQVPQPPATDGWATVLGPSATAPPRIETQVTYTRPILMTEAVYDGYVNSLSIEQLGKKEYVRQKGMWRKRNIRVPGYKGKVFGGPFEVKGVRRV